MLSMATAWLRMMANLKARITQVRTRIFTSSGENFKQLKVWYGETTSVNGVYSFNYATAGFSVVLDVAPKAIINDTNFNNQVTAHINTYSLTAMTGRVTAGASIVLGGAPLKAAPNTKVIIAVTGL